MLNLCALLRSKLLYVAHNMFCVCTICFEEATNIVGSSLCSNNTLPYVLRQFSGRLNAANALCIPEEYVDSLNSTEAGLFIARLKFGTCDESHVRGKRAVSYRFYKIRHNLSRQACPINPWCVMKTNW